MMNGKAWNNDVVFTFDDFGFHFAAVRICNPPRDFQRRVQKTIQQKSAVLFDVKPFPFRAVDKFISLDFERRGIGVAFHHVENVIFTRLERKQARPVFDDVIADVFFKTPYVFHIKFFEARFFKHFRAVLHGVISSVRFIQKFFYVHKYVLNVY